ncbi:MAG: EAL domain-containing protein [Oscillospiraceae bacterium]|nr:EAL domain-containing protein [Oscillospiraceae bacterium]
MPEQIGYKPLKRSENLSRPESLAYIDWQFDLPNGLKLERDAKDAAVAPSLIVVDVLSLREINEICGRGMGDKLLESIRDYISSLDIPNSALYRIGGGKFCISITGEESESVHGYAAEIANRFTLLWNLNLEGVALNTFCDFIMCVIHAPFVRNGDDLLSMIERTLKITRTDASRIIVYDDTMDKDFRQRRSFEISIKRSIANDMEGFDVYYQPIADPVTGIWCGLEALCRWNSPELGPVPPSVFIPETERLDLIETIGLWVLETSIRKCKEWGLDKHKKFFLDVNVSAAQFADAMLAPKVIKLLKDYDFPGERLCLEITESTQFTFDGLSLLTIERIKCENVRVALDDFGTGYSAFNKLKDMPVDIVKVERAFVNGIETDSYLRYLFRAMAELSHASDMMVVAEGVETPEQMAILLKNGADFLQGYLFSKPIKPEDMADMLPRFHELDKSFNMIRKEKVDLAKLFQSETEYVFSPSLHRLMNQCIHILLHDDDISRAIQQALELIGRHMDVSRVYLYQHDGKNAYKNTHEWIAESCKPSKHLSKQIHVSAKWIEALSEDGIISSSDVKELPPGIKNETPVKAAKSIAVIPLWDGNVLSGFIGFNDCQHYRDWRAEEILILHNLCTIIASVLVRFRTQSENNRRKDILANVLDRANMIVYVSDIHTGEILFANEYTKSRFGQDIVGKICWKAMRDSDKRCDFCKVNWLTSHPESRECVWEELHPMIQTRYKIYESLIPWLNGEMVHMVYAVEIPK